MRLVFLGPPGAGKGTVAKIFARRHVLAHISTGDLLRSHIERQTKLGKEAKAYVNEGKLVPDELVIEMVRERLKERDATAGFILDGFPRTAPQARALKRLLEEEKIVLDHVLNFDVKDETILSRLSGRLICEQCAEVYHATNIPPKQEGVCDRCGGRLIQRKDDSRETVTKRLDVYRKETAPLVAYYEGESLLREVPGDLEVRDLEAIVEKLFA